MKSLLFKKKALAIALAVSVAGLVACTSGEERQAQYYEKAKEYFEAGNSAKARVEVKNVLQINPEHADARYLMALLEERDQNWQAVFPNLQKAIEINPAHVKARVKLGSLMIAMGAYKEGEEQAKEVMRLDPKNPNGPLLMAGLYLKQGKQDEALKAAKDALLLDPQNEDATGLLATVQSMTNLDEALATLNAALAQKKESQVLRIVKIRLLESAGRLNDVVPLYDELIQAEPNNAFYVRRQVALLVDLKQKDAAERALRKFQAANPSDDNIKLWLIEFLGANRTVDVAEKELQGFIAAAPESWALQEGLGRLYALTEQYDKAREVFESIRKKATEKEVIISATNRQTEVEVKSGKADAAKKLVAEVLEMEPENTEALTQRAVLRLAEKDVNGSIADLRVVLKQNPESVQALSLMAVAQLQSGNSESALEHFDRVLSVDPGNSEALVRSAQVLLQQGQEDKAEARLKAVLARNAQHPVASQMAIELYARKQQWDKALAQVGALAKEPKLKPMSDYWLGVIELRQGRVDEAITALKSSLAGAPRSIDSLKALVSAYASSGRAAEAKALLEEYTKAQPDLPQAADLLGQLYRQEGDANKAMQVFQGVTESAPKYWPAYMALFEMKSAKGDTAGALAILDQADKQLPDLALVSMVRAEAMVNLGKLDQARELYEKVLAKEPGSVIAKNNLASLLLDNFSGEEILQRVKVLVDGFENSKTPAFLDTAGWYHYMAGNTPQALSLLKAAVAASPNEALFHYHLGMALLKDGQKAPAKEQLELALKRPNFKGAEEARKALAGLAGQ